MTDHRRSSTIAILAILAVFAGGVIVSARLLAGGGLLPHGDRVAVLPLEGAILAEDAFVERLDRYRRDDRIRGFVIDIESPGGTVGASQAIYEAIRSLREEDGRPVVAWMGDVAASGGYYAAVAADSVFALPGTITGSIGVIMEFPNAAELYRKIGLGWEVVKSGEHKDIGSLARPLNEGDRVILQGLVDDVHAQFVEAVAANRPLSRGEIESLADGRVFSGRQAAELGLVDRVATREEAIAVAGRMAGLGSDPRIERPEERGFGLWDLVFGSAVGARGLLRTWGPRHSGTPRLLYEWR